VGNDSARRRRASLLTRVPYVTGGVLYILAGALNPQGLMPVFLAAVVASFVSTSALVWMAELFRDGQWFPLDHRPPIQLPRQLALLIIAGGIGLIFIVVLGSGVSFGVGASVMAP
jgi:hypothetical protein